MTAPSPWVEYTWQGQDGWLWQGAFFIPADYDPTTGTAVIFLAPPGGRGSIPPPVAGAPGLPSPPRNVTVNQVAPGGTIPAPVVNIVDPGGPGVAATWDLTFWVYEGATGPAATVALLAAVDLSGASTAQAGDYLVYEPGGNGVLPYMTFGPPLVGGWYYPATINSTTSANGPQRTLCSVNIPAQRVACTLTPEGGTIISPTGPNQQTNLVARLNATSGSDIGVAVGLGGASPEKMTLWPGNPPGSPAGYGVVAANAGATVFLQAEQQSGTDSFTTSAASTRFRVKVDPVVS